MKDLTLERIGAASGIGAAVLSPVGFALIASAGFGGDPSMAREEIARAFAAPAGAQVVAGAMLDTLGGVCFLIFAARLCAILRRAEGAAGWISAISFAGALMALAGSFVDKAAFLTLGFKVGHGLELEEAVILSDLTAGSFLLAQTFMGVVFVGAAGLVAVRMRAMPAWLGWSALAIALGNLVGIVLPPDAGVGQIPFMMILVWMLVTSIYLIVQPAAATRLESPLPQESPA